MAGDDFYVSGVNTAESERCRFHYRTEQASAFKAAWAQADGAAAGTQQQQNAQAGGAAAGTQQQQNAQAGGTAAGTQQQQNAQAGGTAAGTQQQQNAQAGGTAAGTQKHCSFVNGPAYSTSGPIQATDNGTTKTAHLDFSAKFGNNAKSGEEPGCCEVHQFLNYDQRFAASNGGPPHSGFQGTQPNTNNEDRDENDKRYGHRNDSHSDLRPGDLYTTNGKKDDLHGIEYSGRDYPSMPSSLTGTFTFHLEGVDTCNGNAVVKRSPDVPVKY